MPNNEYFIDNIPTKLIEEDYEIDNTEIDYTEENIIIGNFGIDSIINEEINIDVKEEIENKCVDKYILNDNQIENILQYDSITPNKSVVDLSIVETVNEEKVFNKDNKYTLDDLKTIFNKFNDAILLIQIIDGNIKYIEKKGYESRNQSIVDLLYKANEYQKLPNIQFLIYTNDNIENTLLSKCPYLFTFYKKYSYDTQLFPIFNFNHWLELNIDNYEVVYNYFINNSIEWNNKQELIFWSGSIDTNTNNVYKKINKASKTNKLFSINPLDNRRSNIVHITDINKYKYLISTISNTYDGRLNYLFMSGSCVIILKNEDKEKVYEEYYYEYFIPNEDYIEVKYNDSETGSVIINKILKAIEKYKNDSESMALRCTEKAKKIFNLTEVYKYINNSLTQLSTKTSIKTKLETTTLYIPPLNKYFKNRLFVSDNSIKFNYQGSDMDIILYSNSDSNKLRLNILGDSTKIYYNEYLVIDKYTPFILNTYKPQHYLIKIENSNLSLIIENKFRLLNVNINDINNNAVNFKFDNVDIMSNYGCWILL